MGFWVQFGIQAGLSLVSYFLNKKGDTTEDLKSQRDPNEIESRGQIDYDLLFVIGERKVRARVFYQEVEEYTVTKGPHFSAAKPGRGRILHVGATFSQDVTDSTTQITVDDDVFDADGSAGNREELPWKKEANTDDGGIVITGTTRRRGNWKMTFNHLADGTQGSSLRSAAARAVAQHAQNLAFGENAKGYGISYVHMEFDQPPSGDIRGVEVIAGDPFPVVWDDDNDGPNVDLVVRGKKLKMPTRGSAYSDFPEIYTANWAAAELWRVHEFEGTKLRNINMDSFIDAAEISDTEIMVDSTDELCQVRFAYIATKTDARPRQLVGNAFPPPAPGRKTREAAIAASGQPNPFLWYALSFQVDGTWLNWGAWLSLGMVNASGSTNKAVAIKSVKSTGLRKANDPARRVSFAIDKPSVVVQPFGAPDPGDIDPFPDDDDDDFDPGDPGPDIDLTGGPLPPDVNPGDPEDFYCPQFDLDKNVKLYQVHGVISSDDSIESIEDEMGFAGSGHVVSDGGMLYAMPGWDRDPVAHVDATNPDVVRVQFQSAPPLSERINAGSVKLANSRAHHWNAYTTPQIVDREQRIRDGKLIHRNFGTRAYVTSPTLADILVRHELAASRPWKIAAYRLPIEYSKALRHAVPGNRITLFDPEIDLNPVITRNESNPLFAYGNADGRYMRLLGRSFNFDDDMTMTILVIEHPDGVHAPRMAFPGLEPDPSSPGAFVGKPTGLALTEEVYVDDDGNTRSRIVGTSDLASVAERIVQWRPVIPGGPAGDRYNSITTQDGNGKDVVLRATPAFGEPRQFSISGSDFTIDNVRKGITYEVRLIDKSFAGIESEPSDGATITLVGNQKNPADPKGLIAAGILNGYYLKWDDTPEADIDKWEVYASTVNRAAPLESDLVGNPRSPEFVLSSLALPPNAKAYGRRYIWVRAKNKAGKFSGYAKTSVVPLAEIEGADGEDGNGVEYCFCIHNSPILPVNQRPLNSWGYDILMAQPQNVNGKVWTDGAQELTSVEQWLLRSRRRVPGNPPIGTDIDDLWTIPVPISHFGLNGLPPPDTVSATSSNRVQSNLRQSILTVDWDDVDGAAAYLVVYQYQLGAGANVKLSTGSTRVNAPNSSVNIVVSDSASGSNRSVAYWSVTVHTIDSEGTVGGPSETVEVDGVVPTVITRLDTPSPSITVGNQRIDIRNYNVTNGITYTVQYRRTTSSLWTTLSDKLTGGNTFISGLVNGAGYIVRVRATNGNVNSAWWTSGTLTPMGLPVNPTSPTSLRETSKSENSIQWDWSPPSSFGTGSGLIYRWILRKGAAQVATGTTSARFHRATGLDPSTTYTLSVRAETNAGNSPYASDTARTDAAATRTWKAWGSVTTQSLAASGLQLAIRGVADTGAEREGSILRWDENTPGIWTGATDTGIFCAHEVTIDDKDVIIQTFQSATSNGNRHRRTDTDAYFSTNISYLSPFGDQITAYRATTGFFNNTGDFCVPIRNVRGVPVNFYSGTQPIRFARWNKDIGSDSGTLTVYALTTDGRVRSVSRRYEL